MEMKKVFVGEKRVSLWVGVGHLFLADPVPPETMMVHSHPRPHPLSTYWLISLPHFLEALYDKVLGLEGAAEECRNQLSYQVDYWAKEAYENPTDKSNALLAQAEVLRNKFDELFPEAPAPDKAHSSVDAIFNDSDCPFPSCTLSDPSKCPWTACWLLQQNNRLNHS